MKNSLKILIITGTVILVVVIFIVVSLLNPKKNPPPSQTNTPTPTPEFVQGELYTVKITPIDTTKTYTPAQPIEITFTQDVDKLALKYEITPAANTFVVASQNPNSLIIVPTTVWSTGSTSITILEDTTSTGGRKLKNPQTYILNAAIPTIPQDLEGNY